LLGFLPGCAAPMSDAAPERVRVMTWNIRHGRGLDGKVDLARIAAVVRDSGADVVALQEVDRGTRRTDRRDLAAEIGELCGMEAVFGANLAFEGGSYGNALLTRLPIVWQRNRHYRMLREGEQRGVLQVGLRVGERELAVLVTHIDHRPDDEERLANLVELEAVVGELGTPHVLLCGDFNDVPGSRTHAAARRGFTDAWLGVGAGAGDTYPAGGPQKRIDWVLLRDAERLAPLRAWVVPTEASDHLPLVVDLHLH
jgi:endonuclease/exonuclease/phosphatase family metal-dependent hydrolase